MILVYKNLTERQPHQDPALSAHEREAYMDEMVRLMTEISESGELGPTDVLDDPALARTIRASGETLTTTDGPFMETKEQLAGYFVVDVKSFDRAIDIASRFPDIRYGATFEVRPISSFGPPI